MDSQQTGRLYGVGVGPGDPELLTLKARRVIEACDVVAHMAKRGSVGVARRIVEPYLREHHVEVALAYPITTEETDHPAGYEGALREFYDEAAATLASHLDEGRDVAMLCEGDPFFYGSYMYVHERLADRYPTEVIPGVTSFSAAAAAAGTPLVRRDQTLTVLPGTLAPEELTARLRTSDAAVVLKLGRTFESVRAAAQAAGVDERGIYVERASSERERVARLEDVDAGSVPYMSLLLLPGAERRKAETSGEQGGAARETDGEGRDRGGRDPSGGADANGRPARGSVAIVGLGPGAREWMTPEARAELEAAEELVGYGPYLERVPVRPGQRRHSSDNRVEAQRARHALELAAAGARVAVVSSGDPGIFAMASAVLEQLEQADPGLDVEVRVVPGLSAMQAAAARAGAPLGHDFCVISLSDRLKPWSVIERRLDAAGAADLALALYNPASRTRREQLERAHAVLLRHRDSSTPVVDMRTLLIVGSSQTRTIARNGNPPLLYTPRSYPG